MCECENDWCVLLVLLVVDETGEVAPMARELGKHELIPFVTRQGIQKLLEERHTQCYVSVHEYF